MKTKKDRQQLVLDDAIGNIYRAAFFLARDGKERNLAETVLDRALMVLSKTDSQSSQPLIELKNRIKQVKTKKERLILAELILDEYKKRS